MYSLPGWERQPISSFPNLAELVFISLNGNYFYSNRLWVAPRKIFRDKDFTPRQPWVLVDAAKRSLLRWLIKKKLRIRTVQAVAQIWGFQGVGVTDVGVISGLRLSNTIKNRRGRLNIHIYIYMRESRTGRLDRFDFQTLSGPGFVPLLCSLAFAI